MTPKVRAHAKKYQAYGSFIALQGWIRAVANNPAMRGHPIVSSMSDWVLQLEQAVPEVRKHLGFTPLKPGCRYSNKEKSPGITPT